MAITAERFVLESIIKNIELKELPLDVNNNFELFQKAENFCFRTDC